MKITFESFNKKHTRLHDELLSSLQDEHFTEQVRKDCFYEVKLLINGIETEPYIFNELMTKLEEYIDGEARQLIKEKFQQAENEANELIDAIREAKEKLIDKYNL